MWWRGLREGDRREDVRTWEDNIKIQHAGCGDMDWIDLVQDRDKWRALVNAVMNLLVP
jgi:hypothetical protein